MTNAKLQEIQERVDAASELPAQIANADLITSAGQDIIALLTEVRQLQAVLFSDLYTDEDRLADAFRRGAEVMREACLGVASRVERDVTQESRILFIGLLRVQNEIAKLKVTHDTHPPGSP